MYQRAYQHTVFDLVDRHPGFANLRPLILYVLFACAVWFLTGCNTSYGKEYTADHRVFVVTRTMEVAVENDAPIADANNEFEPGEYCKIRYGGKVAVLKHKVLGFAHIVRYKMRYTQSSRKYDASAKECPTGSELTLDELDIETFSPTQKAPE